MGVMITHFCSVRSKSDRIVWLNYSVLGVSNMALMCELVSDNQHTRLYLCVVISQKSPDVLLPQSMLYKRFLHLDEHKDVQLAQSYCEVHLRSP